jgi:hypothetical protein
MDVKNSKSIFAKLLAQENLTVVHAKVQTAYFDTKNRTLTLPIWADMDGDLYDLLCGHEVGHAINTPAAGWHDAICGPDGNASTADHTLKGYLNVLEDARIEKKIKIKYPGLRASFYRAYQTLFEKDFFGVKGKDLNELMLIDRINLHFKLGSFVAVPFDAEEKKIIQRVERLETWDEVVALARELMAKAKRELEEQQGQIRKKLKIRVGAGEMGDSFEKADLDLDDYDDIEFEFDEDSEFDDLDDAESEEMKGLSEVERRILQKTVESLTDREFRERESLLLDESSKPYEYITVPTIKAQPFIATYKQVLQQLAQPFDPDSILPHTGFTSEQLECMPRVVAEYRRKNDKAVNYLVKEFELRRNAAQLARARVSKSGEIDVKKVFSYRYNEDLFRRITTVPNGKNHGLIMMFDMSGSMTEQMGATIEQMIVLVDFCRKVSIPFEVYGFTNDNNNPTALYYQTIDQRQPKIEGEAHVDDNCFYLRQYFSDQMRPSEYKQQVGNMLLMAGIWRARANRYGRRYDDEYGVPCFHIPKCEDLNGTPLNPAIMLSFDVFHRFKERTKSEVVNLAFLTDGDSDSKIRYVRSAPAYGHGQPDRLVTISAKDPEGYNVVLTHKETRKSVRCHAHDYRHTQGLVSLLREVTGANVVCFDIVANQGRRTLGHKMHRGLSYYKWTPEQHTQVDVAYRKFKKERIFVLENQGFNEHYMIPGGRSLEMEDEELAVEDGADKKKILKAFSQMQTTKQTNRILLNRFVGMIA